jgi:hypothetical protein
LALDATAVAGEAWTRRYAPVVDIKRGQRAHGLVSRHAAVPVAGLVYAAVGLLSCLNAQILCFNNAFTDSGRPEGGSARAGYCSGIAHWERWVVFPLLAVAIGAGAARLAHRRRRPPLWGFGAVTTAAVAHLVIVGSLSAAYLVP